MGIFKECPYCGAKSVLEGKKEIEGRILRIFECRNGHRFKVKEDENALERLPGWARILMRELEGDNRAA